jgi:hypothetical protein
MAVGSGPGGALVEHWNGRRWSIQPTILTPGKPDTGLLPSGLRAVSCTTTSACTALGSTNTGVPSVERWNGRGWSIQALSLDGIEPTDVSCGSARACVAVGSRTDCGESDCIVSTDVQRWNGKRWSLQQFPIPASWDFAFESVSCVSANACTAVGYFDPASCHAGCSEPWVERWDGKRWSLGRAPKPRGAIDVSLDAVSCTSTVACAVVGGSNSGTGAPFAARTHGRG